MRVRECVICACVCVLVSFHFKFHQPLFSKSKARFVLTWVSVGKFVDGAADGKNVDGVADGYKVGISLGDELG